MEKTNFTLFHLEKAVNIVRRFKFLALSMVFTLIFLGANSTVFAQSVATSGLNEEVASLFKNYDFIEDKNEAYSILEAEVTAIIENVPSGGGAEATHSATVLFMKHTAHRLQNNMPVLDALSYSYADMEVFVSGFKGNINVDTEAIALSVADMLD